MDELVITVLIERIRACARAGGWVGGAEVAMFTSLAACTHMGFRKEQMMMHQTWSVGTKEEME